MATNKHATIRYQVLDRCFRNPGRKYFIEDLVNACNDALEEYTGNEDGVKRRQVLEDIKFMESSQGWNIPLDRIRDGHRVFFRYEDRSFSINNQPLNPAEESQLKEALLTLSRFKGLPQFGWIDELSTKLDSGLGLSKSKDKIIQFDENPNLIGLDKISPLYEATLNKQALHLIYKSYRSNVETEHIFHPYFLKQYNNRWFVFGLDERKKQILNFALDRIESIKIYPKSYRSNTGVDFDTYFENIVGVNFPKDGHVRNVILMVSNERLPWIKSKPLHRSQIEIEKGDTHTKISLNLIPNYELEALLLSFGDDLEILEPLEFRNTIKSKLNRLYNIYLSSEHNLQT